MSKPQSPRVAKAPKGRSNFLPLVTLAVVAIGCAAPEALRYLARLKLPPPLAVPYKHYYVEDVFSKDDLAKLLQMVKEENVYKTAVADITTSASIGETVPYGHADCSHNLMVSDTNRTKCFMPQRVDVASHHLFTGGREGFKEKYDLMVSRMQPFIKYWFDKLDSEQLKKLFESPEYLRLARDVCKGNDVFDPIQLNLILVLPGQDLPMHLDVPWFWRASRFSIPQWLLVVMEFSGLFEEQMIPQIQGVMWLHDSSPGDRGDFYYYPSGTGGECKVARSKRNAMIVVDGCRVVHGVDRFRPKARPPVLDKTSLNELVRVSEDGWEVRSNGKYIASYNSSDLRISLVWRARCFASEEKKNEYHSQKGDMSVEQVLEIFKKDLAKKGRLPSGDVSPIQMAELLLGEYVKYPIADGAGSQFLPWNFCLLPKLFPFASTARSLADSLVAPFCEDL